MLTRFMRVPVVAAVIAAAAITAACGPSGGSSAASQLERTNLTVAAVPATDSAGLYIAAQRGLFAKEGLHVTIVPAISGETTIAGQLSGKYDVTLGNYVSYMLWDMQHHDALHILAAASIMAPHTQELMVPADSKIRTIAQLKGKRIGVNVQHNIGTLLVGSVLNDNALSTSDVTLVAKPFPEMAHALQTHQVDAAWLPEPFITSAEISIGAQPLADTDQGATQDLAIAGYMVTKSWLQKYPRTAAAFKRAISEGQAIANQSLAAVQQGMVAYAKVPPQVAAILAPCKYPPTTDARLIQRVASLMWQFGMIQHEFNVRTIIGPGS